MPQPLSDLMKEYKKWCNENKKEQTFVFGGASPFADSNIDRYFKEKCAEANIKKIRIHDFRHSHASLLISKGASIVAVAKRYFAAEFVEFEDFAFFVAQLGFEPFALVFV